MEQGQRANEAEKVINILEILQCFELRAQGQGQWIRNQLSLWVVLEGKISYKLPADTSFSLLSPRNLFHFSFTSTYHRLCQQLVITTSLTVKYKMLFCLDKVHRKVGFTLYILSITTEEVQNTPSDLP